MDEPIVADQQPIVQPPKASPAEKLYDLLNKDGYSEQQLGKKEQFLKAVQNPIAANKLYSGLRTDGYSEQQIGSLKDFQTAVGAKKKEVSDNAFPDGTPMPAKDAPNTSKPLQFGTPNDQNFNIDKNQLVNQAPTTNDLISHQSNKKIAADQQDKQTRDLFKNPDFLKDLKGNQDIVNNHLKAQLNDEGSQYYKDKASDEEKNAYKGTITLGDRAAALNNSIYNGIGNYGKGLIRVAGTILKSITPNSMGDSWDKAQNDLTGTIDKGVDLATDKLDPAKEAEINKGPINGMVNSLANFVPAIADAERTGGMSFFFNDYEKGYEDITKQAENSGIDVSAGKKQAFATVRGITSALLMSHNLHSLLGNASEATTDKLLNTVTTGAIDDLYKSGADFTHEATGQAVKGRLDILEDKVKNLGVKALKGSLISAGDMAAFETANIGAEHLINTVTGKQVFDTSNDAERVQQALKGGLALGIVGSLAHAPLLLAKGTEERGSVIESLYKDPSQGNADRIKNAVQEHLQANGIEQADIDGTIEKVDQLHQIVKTLPKGLSPEKQLKVSELLIDRKHLEKQQADTNAENEAKDPVFSDQHENQAQVYQDRIDGTNDKIKSIVADKPLKYFRDEEGQPMKQFGEEEPEKITEDRYYSEKPNSLFKNEPENVQNNESFMNHEQNKDSLTNNPKNDESSSEKGGEKISPETEGGQKEAQLPTEKEVVNPDGDKKPSDTTKDDLAEPQFSNPKEADRHWIEHEIDPNEIAARYHMEENFANTKQKAIIDYLGNSKINERDYNRWGDSKRLGGSADPKRLRWIDSKNSDDTGLDVHAEILSHEIGQQVTPEDIIDVIDHYKGKQHFNEENKTDTQRALEQRYEDLTGNKLTPKRAEKAFEGKLKLTTPETKEADELLQEVHNINLKDYEQSERNQSSEGDSPTSTDEKSTQRPEDDSNGTLGENRQGETAQGEETAKNSKISEKAKTLADKIRSLKSDKSTLRDGLLGIPVAIYDGALETAATIIEQGGKLADAIQAAVEHIRDKSDQKDEDKIKAALTKSLNEAGISDTEVDEKATYGTKNAITEELQQGLGLPPIEIPKDRSDDESLAAWKDGTRTPQEIIEGLLSPDKNIYDKSITPNDEPIMREYIRQLGERGRELNKIKLHLEEKANAGDKQAEMDVASVTQQINRHLDEYNDALNASKVGGNVWHKYGDERQKAIDDKGLLLNAIERIQNIYGKDIPDNIKQQLKDLQKKHDELVAKNDLLEQKIKDSTAKENFEKAKPKTFIGTKKKTDAEFKKEREDIVEQMKRDLKKSLGQLNSTLPGLPQLNAIAPHVAKLLKSFADQGINKLDEAIDKVHDIVKDVVDGISKEDIRDIIAGRYSEKKPLSELQKQVNELRTQARNKIKIEELERGISIKTKSKGEASEEVKALQKQVLELKKQVLNQYANLSADELKRQSITIQKQIDKGDFFKQPIVKRKWETNPEWIKNNIERADLMFKLRKMEQEAMNSKKSKYMRALDWGNRWGRRVIFFGANAVYTKLSSAAVLGSFLHRLPEQGLGFLNAKMFPHIARTSPLEGQFNWKVEGQFYRDFLNPVEFAKDVKDIILTGETRLSKANDSHPPGVHIPIVDLFAADGHQIIKSMVKRATNNAAYNYMLDWYEKNGVDASHPMILESARQTAWRRANYEVFQDNPKNQTKIKEFFSQLAKSGVLNRNKPDIWSKVQGNAQYSAAALYHFFIPINTVPVNILKRVGLGPMLPITYLKAIAKNESVKNGILNMTHEESDAILLHLKKGQIMAAYWTLGFILGGTTAGGLYTNFYPDKERDQDAITPDADYLSLRGIGLSKNIQHNSQFQGLQMGATWRMVHDHYVNDKGESQLKAIFAASAATAGAAAQEHPVISEASKMIEAVKSPSGNTRFIKGLKQRVGVNKANSVLQLMGYGDSDE